MSTTWEGRCHCGAIGYSYTTGVAPRDWSVRACQCPFCRAHGARCTSDPRGSARFHAGTPDALVRYRFGLHTADFLLCRHGGVYIGAVVETDAGRFATLNVNALADVPPGLPPATAASYEGESTVERLARRARRWTPVDAGDPPA